jgi:hypothetical protein
MWMRLGGWPATILLDDRSGRQLRSQRKPEMRYLSTVLLAVVIVFVGELVADAQLNTNDDTNTGTNTAGNISGQTGQSDRFAIERDAGAFVGGSTTNVIGSQAATGGGGVGTAGLLGALGSVGNRNNNSLFNQFNQQGNTQGTAEPQIRFRITLGFSHPRPTGTKVSATFARRLSRIPQLPSARSVAVTMEDRTAVLAGQVDSERAKRLIEKLAMMEPGVSAVRNELMVKATEELLPLPEATN